MLFVAFLIIAVVMVSEIITLLTPLVVFGVTELVKFMLPKVQGWMILLLIVPLLSLLLAWLSDLLIAPDLGFWPQFIYGLLAVFVKELFKQLKPAQTTNG